MKPTLNRLPPGGALLPKVITALVLHVGAIADRTAPRRLRLKTTVERLIAKTPTPAPDDQ
ncbi:MAG: hypothetical protein QOE70_1459 [Chthoniobacter sp.]|jgi:hypothetical protein|nr:hypothetical protein [Chthoniobacter sp.]